MCPASPGREPALPRASVDDGCTVSAGFAARVAVSRTRAPNTSLCPCSSWHNIFSLPHACTLNHLEETTDTFIHAVSPPKCCLLSAVPERSKVRRSACGLGSLPGAAFRDSAVSRLYPFPLPLSKTLLEGLKAHLPSSSMSRLRVPPLQHQHRACKDADPPGRWGRPWQRGEGAPWEPAKAEGMRPPISWSILPWRRHSPGVRAAKAILLAPNLVLRCERLRATRRHRSTQLAVLTQAPGRMASILGEY